MSKILRHNKQVFKASLTFASKAGSYPSGAPCGTQIYVSLQDLRDKKKTEKTHQLIGQELRHGTQHNDIQRNDTQHNATQHNNE